MDWIHDAAHQFGVTLDQQRPQIALIGRMAEAGGRGHDGGWWQRPRIALIGRMAEAADMGVVAEAAEMGDGGGGRGLR